MSSGGGEERPEPLAEYGALIATFTTIVGVGAAAAWRQGRMPERVRADDIVIGGVAAQKVARLVAKDRIASPVRAPFTEVEGKGRSAEMEERPRGRGVRRVIGELLTCPFCLSQWIAAAYVLGLVFAPRVTRFVAAMMAVVGLSDFLQIAYKAAENRRDPDAA
jgi:hypothetical protein